MDKWYNVLVSGPSASGKTSFVNQLLGKQFIDHHIPTVGFSISNLNLLEFPPIRIKIWDTPGDPKYRTVCQKYYPDVDLDIIVTTTDPADYIRTDVPTIVVWSKADIHSHHKSYELPTNLQFELRWSNDHRSLASRSMSVDEFKYKLSTTLLNISY